MATTKSNKYSTTICPDRDFMTSGSKLDILGAMQLSDFTSYKFIMRLGGLLILLVLIGVMFVLPSPNQTTLRQTPDLTITDAPQPLTDQQQAVVSDLRLKIGLADSGSEVIILTFWAEWCTPCIEEMTDQKTFQNHFADQPLKLIAINSDKGSAALDRAQAIWSDKGWGHKFIADSDGLATQAFSVDVLPNHLVIDQAGQIIYRWIGAIDWLAPEMIEAINRLTSKKPQTKQ